MDRGLEMRGEVFGGEEDDLFHDSEGYMKRQRRERLGNMMIVEL